MLNGNLLMPYNNGCASNSTVYPNNAPCNNANVINPDLQQQVNEPAPMWGSFSRSPTNIVDLSVDRSGAVINLSSEDDEVENSQPINLSRKRHLSFVSNL